MEIRSPITAGRITATDGLVSKTKAGAVVDGDFVTAAVDGQLGVDTTNHVLYYRSGGVWRTTGPGVQSTRQIIAGTGLTGGGDLSADRTLNVIANVDGSIVVAADNVKVGVLATDAQHGNRGGGALHANAVAAGAAGFMTGADKTKIDAAVITSDSRLTDARVAAGQILDNGWVPALSAGSSTTYTNVGTSPTRAIVLPRPSVVFAIWSFACAGSGVAGQELGVRYNATASAGPALASAIAFEQFFTLEPGMYSAASLAGAWIVTVAATITVAVQYKISTGSAYINFGTSSPVVYYAIPYA